MGEEIVPARVMMFVDGQNLMAKFQNMVAEGGRPKSNVVIEEDRFVWLPEVGHHSEVWNLTRVSYYASAVGSKAALRELHEKIAAVKYTFDLGSGFLKPQVFKKQNRNDEAKSVDINLVTDVLRHTYNKSVDEVCLLSGDGDYLPTIREVMRQGVRVSVGAFSAGLDERLRTEADEFIDLDALCFEPDRRANKRVEPTFMSSDRSGVYQGGS